MLQDHLAQQRCTVACHQHNYGNIHCMTVWWGCVGVGRGFLQVDQVERLQQHPTAERVRVCVCVRVYTGRAGGESTAAPPSGESVCVCVCVCIDQVLEWGAGGPA